MGLIFYRTALIKKVNKWAEKIFTWLRDVIPSVTAVGSLIYNYMLRKVNTLQKEKNALELELEYKENEDAVEKENIGKSDSDIINDAISKGRESNGS